ncbi:hypothetical protein BGX24_007913 [Mortierella sp. AD032]|nr:hypothetical protein BGX24_007913 [Mortierella sp. AD032]
MATVTGVSWLVRSRGKGVSTGVTTLVLAIVVGLTTAAPTFAALPTPISAVTAKTYLGSLTVSPENNSPAFDRSLFPIWDIISSNCDTERLFSNAMAPTSSPTLPAEPSLATGSARMMA